MAKRRKTIPLDTLLKQINSITENPHVSREKRATAHYIGTSILLAADAYEGYTHLRIDESGTPRATGKDFAHDDDLRRLF